MRQYRKLYPMIVFLLCILLSFGLTEAAVSQSAGTLVFVDPGQKDATTCSEETIAICVANVEDLTAFDILVEFDPEVIDIIDVENGGFLVAPGEPKLYSPDNNDGEWNEDGFIRFGLTQQRDSVTGELEPKTGSGDLALITLKALVPNASTDITIDAESSMLVEWPDVFGLDFTVVNGTVETFSCPPTALELSKLLVPENEPVGTEVGQFATSDPDSGDSFTYTLVNTLSYPDNNAFEIDGARLVTLESFNYEEKNSYEIRVRSTDSGGEWVEETFTITVEDVNDRPLAFDQSVITKQEQAVAIKLEGYDEDGDPLTFDVTDAPKFGALSGISPNLVYTPADGYVGPDSFKFTTSDDTFTSEEATVSIIMESKWIAQYMFPIFYAD